MPSQDVSNAVIPLWAAIVGLGGVLTALGAVVAWAISTFESKDSAGERHDTMSKRVDSQETLLASVARDVSYIRGRMEPK